MRTAREVGITTVAVAAMMFSSTSLRAQRAVAGDCASPANAAVPLGPDGDCALRDASVRLFQWLLDGGDGDMAFARSAPGLGELRFVDSANPFSFAWAGASAADRRGGSAGDEGLSSLLWDPTSPSSVIGATSFWLDVLDGGLSFDLPHLSKLTGAMGLATSPSVFTHVTGNGSNGSNGHGVWSDRGVGRFDNRDRDNHHDRSGSGYEGSPNLTSTPEPGSLALIATGLAGLGGLRFRRRRSPRN